MKDDSMSTKEMLMDISSMKQKALLLAENGKAYTDLLKDILARDLFYDEEASMPSMKELSQATGLKYGKIRKLIDDIYQDLILDHEASSLFTFSKVRYEFLIRGWRRNKFMTLEADQLPVVPRVGEGITLPFFHAYLETSHFFVEKIDHRFEEDTQIVNLWLRVGSYNSYRQYRKDKAKEEYEVGLMDFYQLEEHELKRKLGVGKRMDDYIARTTGNIKK